MSNTYKLQLLNYFSNFVIEFGFDVERKKNALKTIQLFIEEWQENIDNDYDEHPMFEEDLRQAEKYLKEFLEV